MQKENYFWKPLNIEAYKSFVWSDMHLGHKSENWTVPLWRMRGFSSIEDHDDALIARWNRAVSITSDVFHLGDIMFGVDGTERLQNVLSQLHFRNLYLMGGNHHAGYKGILNCRDAQSTDGATTMRMGRGERYGYEDSTVHFIPNYFEVIASGKPFVLSHYPILSWNGQAKGSIMVFGHCHGSLKNSKLGAEYLATAKAEEVCVESHPAPVSFQELIDKFKTKQAVTFDHHDQHTQNPF